MSTHVRSAAYAALIGGAAAVPNYAAHVGKEVDEPTSVVVAGGSVDRGSNESLPSTSSNPPLPPKTPVKVGFYDVERTIGKGNYAVVKYGRHRITKTEVAIKIIDKTRLDESNLQKMYREIRVLKTLSHPHIIKLYQVMETKNMLYLVTEYAPNGEIFDFIAKHGRMKEVDARPKFAQLVSAIYYLHSNSLVHRDLKAENLLLDSQGKIKIADFGFANFYSAEASLTTFCGSPPYAAPEVFQGQQYNGPEIDIWSLGVVLYVFVCGALPFEAPNLQQLRDKVLAGRFRIPYFMSTECEGLLRKMLVLEPTKRYTIAQVHRHKWMHIGAPVADPSMMTTEASVMTPMPILPAPVPVDEPVENVLKLMQSLGIDSTKTKESIANESYDNYSAIYTLLLERWQRGASMQPPPPRAAHYNRRTSENVTRTQYRPKLTDIKDHTSFQTTDCTTSHTQSPLIFTTNNLLHAQLQAGSTESGTESIGTASTSSHYVDHANQLSRQSTVATIASIDEGVELHTPLTVVCEHSAGTSPGNNLPYSMWPQQLPHAPMPADAHMTLTPFNASHAIFVPPTQPQYSSSEQLASPFESFDSQIETDVMSSLSNWQRSTQRGSCGSAGGEANLSPLSTSSGCALVTSLHTSPARTTPPPCHSQNALNHPSLRPITAHLSASAFTPWRSSANDVNSTPTSTQHRNSLCVGQQAEQQLLIHQQQLRLAHGHHAAQPYNKAHRLQGRSGGVTHMPHQVSTQPNAPCVVQMREYSGARAMRQPRRYSRHRGTVADMPPRAVNDAELAPSQWLTMKQIQHVQARLIIEPSAGEPVMIPKAPRFPSATRRSTSKSTIDGGERILLSPIEDPIEGTMDMT